jgi:hypothetical protein
MYFNKSIFVAVLFIIVPTAAFCQHSSLSFGVGPTTSLYHAQGGWVRTWAVPNIDNERQKRSNLGLSFMLQYNKPIKKKKLGYFFSLTYDSYGLQFKNSYRQLPFVVDVNTNEKYRTIFLNVGLEHRFDLNKWKVFCGLGLYNFWFHEQRINLSRVIDNISLEPSLVLSVDDSWGSEGGAFASIRVLREVTPFMSLGIQPMFFYTLSTANAEKLSANFVCAIKL